MATRAEPVRGRTAPRPVHGAADAELERVTPLLPRLTRGEIATLGAVVLFAELLTISWIMTLIEGAGGVARWWEAFLLAGIDGTVLALLVVAVFATYDLLPLDGTVRRRNLVLRVGFLAVIGLLHAWLSWALVAAAAPAIGVPAGRLALIVPDLGEQIGWALLAIGGATLAYRVLSRLHLARALEVRNAALRATALEARLDALAAELRPHFLFNALNDLAELVHHDAARAEEMLLRLASLLRASLEAGRERTVPLRTELAHVDDYLALQELRFGDRLRMTRAIDAAAADAPVPPMLLQPVVENALVHGLEGRVGAGAVTIRATRTDGVLVLEVQDDGPGPHASRRTNGTGTGLRNVRSRLEAQYGRAASLELLPAAGGGTLVRIVLPQAGADA